MMDTVAPKTAADVCQLNTGRTMPVLGLGTWELTEQTAETVACAIELGYRMIDTACDYGSQAGIGDALRATQARSDVYLVAKIEESDDALDATRRYLDEIGVDHADLMLIHRPPANGIGEALWEGLLQARQQGWTRDIGVSNYSARQLEQLTARTGDVPAVNQVEWSPFGHDPGLLEYGRQHGVVLQAYSPLTRARRLDDPALEQIARRYEKSPAQVLLRWNLEIGTVPLPKANQRGHLEEDIDLFDFSIDAADMRELGALNEHYSALGRLAY